MMPSRPVFRCDDLAILDDVEHCAGERIIGLIQLQQFQLDLGVIFKNEGDVGLAIPMEFLPALLGSELVVYPVGE